MLCNFECFGSHFEYLFSQHKTRRTPWQTPEMETAHKNYLEKSYLSTSTSTLLYLSPFAQILGSLIMTLSF